MKINFQIKHMKIAIIGQKGIPSTSGGVEKHVEDLSTRLVKAGHDVICYTRPNYTDENLKEYKGVKLISLPSINSKSLDAISHTFRACLDVVKRDVDLVHFHSIGPSSLIWLVKLLKPSLPVVATFHCEDYYHQKWGFFARTYLKFGEFVISTAPDKTITVSKGLQAKVLKRYKREAVYAPNGVPTNEKVEAKEIKKFGLEKDNYIVAVSRLVKHKGLQYLVEAYNRVKTDKKLVIVGEGAYTSDFVKDLKDKAKNNPNIIFTGKQSGRMLAELFSNAYLFVQPSESEGLSIALLEAMSYGKATLVSNIPENKEVIDWTGFTFKNKNVPDLVGKINGLLKNPSMVKDMGRLGKERVTKEYNWNNIVDNIINLAYTEAVKNKEKKQKNLKIVKLKFVRKIFNIFF